MKIRNKELKIILLSLLMFGCGVDMAAPRKLARDSELAYKKAVAAYQSILSRKKANPAPRIELARMYLSRGDYSNAIGVLKDSSDIKARQLLAVCLYKSGDYTQALSLFEKIGKEGGDEYLYYYALTAQKHNLFPDAQDILENVKGREYSQKAKERLKAIRGLRSLQGLSPELLAQIEDATQDKYPLAAAVILSSREDMRLYPDNTIISQSHFIVKILNDRGKKDFSEIVIGYDSTYEKVEVEYAKTIKPNGEVVVVGEKDIRDVSRYLNFPLYSNARARIISMPEIAEGAVVEYKIKTTQNQLINKKDFNLGYSLYEIEPVVYSRFSLTLPKGRDIKIKILNPQYNLSQIDLAPKIEETQETKNYTWEFRGIPQIEPESDMPPIPEVNPIILISTFESWNDIYQWWWNLAKDRINPGQDITAKVNELIQGKISREDKIRALYNYCVQDIRYVGVEYGQAGYQPHYANEIFKNKYGDCKDKAILFIAMLKAAGIKGYPVLIGTRGTPVTDKDFPAVNFNHCIAAVELDNMMVFLDITAEVCSFGDLPRDDQDRRVLVFKDDTYELFLTPLLPADKNSVMYKTDMRLAKDESVTAKRQVEGLGEFDQAQRYWLRYTPPNLIEQALKEKVQSLVTSGNLIRYSYENSKDLNIPIKLIYEFEGSNFLSRAGSARIMPKFAEIDTSSVAKDKRDYPLELGQPHMNISELSLSLADNLRAGYLPGELAIESRWLDYFISYKLENKELKISQKKVLKKRQVSREEYPEFKKFLEGLAIKLDEHIMLEKENGNKEK